MATNIPLSPGGHKMDFKLPVPPPLLHTRSAEGTAGERPMTPGTPRGMGFTSPYATPQGSPSKSALPPGALELPNVFDNAMRLEPPSPIRLGGGSPTRPQLGLGSPNKGGKPPPPGAGDNDTAVFHHDVTRAPGSPLRDANQENTPPGGRLAKECTSSTNSAALARQGQYHPSPPPQPTWMSSKLRYNPLQALTADEVEKLSLPKVKRLANVTQIYFLDHYFDLLNYVSQREARTRQFHDCYPIPASTPEYEGAKAKWLGRERAQLRKRRTRLRQHDFQILTQVGQGGYGQVYLAQKKDTREVCALKVMSKKLLFKLDEVRHILTERDILTAAKSDWLVKLLYAFQDNSSIYLAMEYVPGGDFRTLLNNTGVLHNRHARFYIAEMFLCVDALHSLGYIHRDLKPENFLIDNAGHVKLTDFGLASGFLAPAKIESMRVKLESVGNVSVPFGRVPVEQRSATERREGYRSLRQREGLAYAKSIVGSPDYMAPEVLQGVEYDFSVDYWSLGCMLYEALAGYPPFAGDSVDETWQNLRHWKQAFAKPEFADSNYYLSTRTWDFICLCVADRRARFATFAAIKTHAYFAEVDWVRIRQQAAPFVPELDSETDAGYFDDFSNEADMAKYKEVHDKQAALENLADPKEKMNKGLFVGFTFRHRKPNIDGSDGAKLNSPRKPIVTDGTFGTML